MIPLPLPIEERFEPEERVTQIRVLNWYFISRIAIGQSRVLEWSFLCMGSIMKSISLFNDDSIRGSFLILVPSLSASLSIFIVARNFRWMDSTLFSMIYQPSLLSLTFPRYLARFDCLQIIERAENRKLFCEYLVLVRRVIFICRLQAILQSKEWIISTDKSKKMIVVRPLISPSHSLVH